VTTQRIGIAAALLTFDAALLLIVGAAMWSEPPFPAEEAVGKGLVTLGACLAVPAFVLVCAYMNVRYPDEVEQDPGRSDWDVV
jgi:ABC-type polysaccharide/polyol phosphate export permease